MENTQLTKITMPIDYLKIIFRRKWFIIGSVYAGLISGIIASYVLPKTYESNTVIMVEEGKIINPIISTLAVSTSLTQRLSTIRDQALGWNNLVQLVKKLNLDKNVDSQYSYEQLILSLRKNIKVGMSGQNLIKIWFQDKDPQKTQSVVKTITEIFVNENIKMQNEETDNAINFINDQLTIYRKKIKEGEIAKMQEDLNKLLMDSTENHPLVKDLRAKIAKAQEELGQDKLDTNADLTAMPATEGNLQQLKEELAQIRNSINLDEQTSGAQSASTSNDAVYKMLLVDKIDKILSQDAKVDENIYNTLLQRLETAKITKRLDASTQGTKYTVIDPPRLPIKPTKPNKFLVIFMGLFLGASAGIGLVLLMEFMDHSLLGIEEAKAYLNYPILGGISRIITAEDLLKEKNVVKKRITFSLTAGVSLVLILMVYSFINGK